MTGALASTEIRWFREGAPPEAMAIWFESCGPLRPPEERTDHYLRFPGTRDVGVKLRRGLFEIKARTGAPRPFAIAPTLAGHADSWIKRSLDAAAFSPIGEGYGPEDWMPVRKRRRVRVFGLRPAGLAVGLEADIGVSIELAEIVVSGETWWSLALETFGTTAPDFELLAAAARLAVAKPPPETLSETCSKSFPVWIEARAGAASAAG